MSEKVETSSIQEADASNFDKLFRHSLPPKQSLKVIISDQRSQSQRSSEKKKKRTVVLPPVSDDTEGDHEMKDIELGHKVEKEKDRRASKRSEISAKAALAYDNAAYEGHFDRFSRAGSSGAASVQSLEIVREQYCCCAKRTPCERKLIILILVLVLVIIVLLVVISVIVTKSDGTNNLKDVFFQTKS